MVQLGLRHGFVGSYRRYVYAGTEVILESNSVENLMLSNVVVPQEMLSLVIDDFGHAGHQEDLRPKLVSDLSRRNEVNHLRISLDKDGRVLP